MDPLDTVFDAMRVQSVLHARLEASSPWGIAFNQNPRAKFILVVRGACWLDIEGETAQRALSAGDCLIMSGKRIFTIRSEPDAQAIGCKTLIAGRLGETIEFGGGGITTTLVSGWFEFDEHSARPLFDALPEVMHTRMDCGRSHLLQSVFQLLAQETAEQGLGSSLVSGRLGDALFILAIRAYLASDDAPKKSWLAALSDRQIGGAMRALHLDLARPWTVERLAEIAAMSRSAFAARFHGLAGKTPMEYLAYWRMHRAAFLLRFGGADLGQVASDVGYRSDAAFNRAFKRVTGETPGEYRRRHAVTAAENIPSFAGQDRK